MARDKLITIRIEGEKRQAFGELAKSQNTDTASLLYDFISGCLDGRIDIKLVTGKGNRIDNQIDSDRLDKLETTTQRLDNRLGQISKKLTDWVIAFDDRLNDCGRELSEKMISLEHRLNALAMQLDSQQDSQQLDSIDTDSQQLDSIDTDSQQIDDMEPLLKRERESSIAAPLPPSPFLPPDKLGKGGNGDIFPDSPPSPPSPPDAIEDPEKKIVDFPDTLIASPIENVESVESISSINEPGTDAIESLPTVEIGSTISSIEPVTSAIETDDREWLTLQQIADKKIKGLPGTQQGLRLHAKNWESRKNPQKRGEQYKIPKEYLTPISPNPD